jgi:hypothetical protein
MKSLQHLALVAALALLACGSLPAQDIYMRANIPFDFHAGDRLIPAGEYAIHERGPLVYWRGLDSDRPAFALITNRTEGRGPQNNRLEFARYGNDYFLKAIWSSITQDGRQLLPAPLEKELAKRGSVPAPATVNLTGSR